MLGGAVLAGGPGRRLGRPKAGVTLAGRTLVERAVDALLARCDEVIVVSRPGIALPRLSVPVVHDRPGPDAPLTGIATALAALSAPDALVLACDLPLAGPLLDALAQLPPGTAAAGAERGRLQPLCARYPRERALAACERLLAAGALPAKGLLEALGAAAVEAPGDALLNVNAPADLARAEEALRRSAQPGAQQQDPRHGPAG
jgi:molybdopterin-guanine dinucleotide biosynthesis protein A